MGYPTIYREIEEIEDRGESIVSERDQARAQHLADSGDFRGWLTREESGCLLVHGDFSQASQVSGLSLFCCSLRRVFMDHEPRFIPLVFFCGMHTGPPAWPPAYTDPQLIAPPEYDEYPDEELPPPYTHIDDTGGCVMIRSLIYQLLRRLRGRIIPMRRAELEGIESGNIDALCGLFSRLLRLYPP